MILLISFIKNFLNVKKNTAEVGLLSRNIVVRGSDNPAWNDKIPACEEGFDTGEFVTQTCFQVRTTVTCPKLSN